MLHIHYALTMKETDYFWQAGPLQGCHFQKDSTRANTILEFFKHY